MKREPALSFPLRDCHSHQPRCRWTDFANSNKCQRSNHSATFGRWPETYICLRVCEAAIPSPTRTKRLNRISSRSPRVLSSDVQICSQGSLRILKIGSDTGRSQNVYFTCNLSRFPTEYRQAWFTTSLPPCKFARSAEPAHPSYSKRTSRFRICAPRSAALFSAGSGRNARTN